MKDDSFRFGVEQESHTRLWYRLSSAEKFQALGTEETVRKGTIIAKAGELPDACWFVL